MDGVLPKYLSSTVISAPSGVDLISITESAVSVPVGDNLGAATFRAESGAKFDASSGISSLVYAVISVPCGIVMSLAFHEKKQRSSRKKTQ